ncbi:MAG TPA: family 16 glycoside hydrolase [Ktedonobacteraceae bacterium]|nr:family 16 glycoside hydrolase [Ktedonobacteraceae bacterium]
MSATTRVQASPTPSVPKGTPLYHANWSHGLDGWQGPQAWKTVGGQLVTRSLTTTSIVVPYKPPVADYAIEIRVQFAQMLVNIHNGFLISANDEPGKDGYQAQIYQLALRGAGMDPPGYIDMATDKLIPSTFEPHDYQPGTRWHTYRIEVVGDQATLFVDGTQMSRSITRENAISNGPIGLTSWGFDLHVSSFVITAL